MNRTVKAIRKVLVAAIGFPLLVIGAILVPLPGPGLLVMLAALVLLSTEFAWANTYQRKVRDKLKAIYQASMERADRISAAAESNKNQKK